MWPTGEDPAYGTFVASQTRSMSELGVSVRVHFTRGYRSRRAFARTALRMLTSNLGDQEFDLIHAHGGYPGALALLARRTPVLTSFVGYDLLGEPGFGWHVSLKSRLESAVFRQLSRFSDRTITKSREMERALPSSARPRNVVLPNGVDRSVFCPHPREHARRQLGWPQDEPVALFVGDPDVGRKRFDLASGAVELARRDFPDLRLRVCTRVGPREVPVWMSAADVLILTSNVEGSPNVIKEAMACDLPIVSSDCGDVREIVEGTRHCHVTSQDPAMLAAALGKVLSAAGARSDGRRRTSHLGLGAVAERLGDLYLETARSHGGSRRR
jgi:glycosyltransferase involved in cell wall biosynthesis